MLIEKCNVCGDDNVDVFFDGSDYYVKCYECFHEGLMTSTKIQAIIEWGRETDDRPFYMAREWISLAYCNATRVSLGELDINRPLEED